MRRRVEDEALRLLRNLEAGPAPRWSPCGNAFHALREAGYEPEVIRTYGLGFLPDALNGTPGRREVKRLTGQMWVPVLVLDDGTVIRDSRRISEWAQAHPAPHGHVGHAASGPASAS